MNNFQNLEYVWVPGEIGFDCLRSSIDGAGYVGHGPAAESTYSGRVYSPFGRNKKPQVAWYS